MKFWRFFLCLLLLFCMVFASPFSVLADTVYNTATSSDALLPDSHISGDGFSSGDIGSLGVTVDADVFTDAGFMKNIRVTGSVSGGSYYFRFPALPQGQWYQNLIFRVGDSFLPKPGKYGFTFSFREAHVGFPSVNNSYVRLVSSGNNITESYEQVKAGWVSTNGNYQIKGNVSIGYNTTSLVSFISIGLNCPRDLDLFLSDDCFQFTYKQDLDVPSVSAPDVDGGGSAENHIAENTGQLVDQQEETNGLLANIIQTISHQLTSFWNQLAGEFTNLFTKMNQQHNDSINKLDDVKDGVTSKLDDVKDGVIDKLEDTKKGIIAGIIDGLKSLFIPSNDFFKAWHPFDGYKGQDVVIFEEFRSSMRINDMLNYLDGYPLELPCRYANKFACFTKVYIISNVSLAQQYTQVQLESYETWLAFLRRIKSVLQYTQDTVKTSHIEFLTNGFRLLMDDESIPFNPTIRESVV